MSADEVEPQFQPEPLNFAHQPAQVDEEPPAQIIEEPPAQINEEPQIIEELKQDIIDNQVPEIEEVRPAQQVRVVVEIISVRGRDISCKNLTRYSDGTIKEASKDNLLGTEACRNYQLP